ncbi:MAG: hypothetical protein ACXU8O_02585, partial [Asticcacaulis sp.]
LRPAEAVVEVPRPAPVTLADDGLHWRDRLQRPLPETRPEAQDDLAAHVEPVQPNLLANSARDEGAADHEWLHDGRVAMSLDEMHHDSVGWWKMLTSTLWLICLGIVGILFLGVAAGAYYKTQDLTVIRNNMQQDLEIVSIVTAVIGIVVVSTSMWLMIRRLGGLKE